MPSEIEIGCLIFLAGHALRQKAEIQSRACRRSDKRKSNLAAGIGAAIRTPLLRIRESDSTCTPKNPVYNSMLHWGLPLDISDARRWLQRHRCKISTAGRDYGAAPSPGRLPAATASRRSVDQPYTLKETYEVLDAIDHRDGLTSRGTVIHATGCLRRAVGVRIEPLRYWGFPGCDQ